MASFLKKRRDQGFTLIELMIVVAIIGILAAIAIPNFIKFQARSKTSEAKSNLKAMFTAERSYFQEHDEYSPQLKLIGFAPERGNRYAYYLGDRSGDSIDRTGTANPTALTDANWITVDGGRFQAADVKPYATGKPTGDFGTVTWILAPGSALAMPATPGVSPGCPDCSFWGTAVGNVDNDTAMDGWFVAGTDSTDTGTCPAGLAGVTRRLPLGRRSTTTTT